MRKGFTKKPCHGCGEAPQDYEGRPAEGVCAACASLLRFAKEAHAKLETDKDQELYALPSCYYELPYVPYGQRANYEHGASPKDKFQKALYDVVHLLAKIDTKRGMFLGGRSPAIEGTKSFGGRGYLNPHVRNALNQMMQAAIGISRDSYAEGKKHGRSFLVDLARGEISIEQYNEVTENAGKPRLK